MRIISAIKKDVLPGKPNSSLAFIFYAHDDILRIIAEAASEKVHSSHMLAVLIHLQDKGEIVSVCQAQAFHGFIGNPDIVQETAPVINAELFLLSELGDGIAPPGGIINALPSAVISLRNEGGDMPVIDLYGNV